jgi:uncharacterized protein YndB with AHSA1/START domain
MPTVQRSRTIAAPAQELWELIGDPHHLPRWWPRVTRVEGVDGGAFTEVLRTQRGKVVRADFQLLDAEAPRRLVWVQQLEGTPFARLFKTAETEVRLTAAAAGTAAPATEVAIELRQSLNGFFPRFGGFMVRRACASILGEALDGLERIVG